MPKAARTGDPQTCPEIEYEPPPSGAPHPHEGGELDTSTTATSVFINGKNAAVVGDTSSCEDFILKPVATVTDGSKTVFIQSKPAARLGDPTDHGGKISEGSDNVFIGD